jgi:hypothetical protein
MRAKRKKEEMTTPSRTTSRTTPEAPGTGRDVSAACSNSHATEPTQDRRDVIVVVDLDGKSLSSKQHGE